MPCSDKFRSTGYKQFEIIQKLASASIFQFYFLQVIQSLNKKYGLSTGFNSYDKDYNLGRSPQQSVLRKYRCCFFQRNIALEIGWLVMLMMNIIYTILLIGTNKPDFRESELQKNDKIVKYMSWTIIKAAFGMSNNFKAKDWPLVYAC